MNGTVFIVLCGYPPELWTAGVFTTLDKAREFVNTPRKPYRPDDHFIEEWTLDTGIGPDEGHRCVSHGNH